MAEKFYMGVPGAVFEVRPPESGMGYDNNMDSEITELVSGGRSIYRAPTAYKSFNLSWKANSWKLKHLIDLYNGQFGPGPFYISDLTARDENVLPARWSNCWQLAHQANGWCKPVVLDNTLPLTRSITSALVNRKVKFTQAASGSVPLEGILRTRVIRVPGKSYYFAVKGVATGGAAIKIRAFDSTTGAWSLLYTWTDFSGTLAQVITGSQYTMIELDVYMPLGSTLELTGMALGTVDYTQPVNVRRKNLCTNPSFEVDTAGWLVSGVTAIATNGFPQMTKSGTKILQATSNGTSASPYVRMDNLPIVAGQWIGFKAFLASEFSGNIQVRIAIIFQDAASTVLSTIGSTYAKAAFYTGAYHQLVLQAPATTVKANIYLQFRNGDDTVNPVASGQRLWADVIQAHVADTQTAAQAHIDAPYFDGTTADSDQFYNRWTGTAHASTSVETTTEPIDYMPPGEGVGPLQFSNTLGGNLVSKTIDRIGLSVDMTEVQHVESMVL